MPSRRRPTRCSPAAARDCASVVGASIYGEDDDDLAAVVLELCRARGLTIGVAESCTGGLLGARLTAIPGSSDVVLGGVIAYHNDVKRELLGVSDETLRDARRGERSGRSARWRPGARRVAGADVGLAITGVAGPGGGTPEKPVGTVWIARRHRRRGPDARCCDSGATATRSGSGRRSGRWRWCGSALSAAVRPTSERSRCTPNRQRLLGHARCTPLHVPSEHCEDDGRNRDDSGFDPADARQPEPRRMCRRRRPSRGGRLRRADTGDDGRSARRARSAGSTSSRTSTCASPPSTTTIRKRTTQGARRGVFARAGRPRQAAARCARRPRALRARRSRRRSTRAPSCRASRWSRRRLLKALAGRRPRDRSIRSTRRSIPKLHEAVATEPALSPEDDHVVARVFRSATCSTASCCAQRASS